MNRRDFIKNAAAAGALVLGGRYAVVLATSCGQDGRGFICDRATDPPLKFSDAAPDPTALYGMVIDAEKCIGCHSCAMACRNEFHVPPGVWKSWVKVVQKAGQKLFLPRLCNHCNEAPCVSACPVKASYRREDGLVLVRYDRCIGCKACMVACPYDARFVHPVKHVVDKCTFCAHRLEECRGPACVEVCPTRARIFGNLNDPSSEISRVLAKTPVQTLKAGLGTHCKVFYANADQSTFGRIEVGRTPTETVDRYEESLPADVRDAFRKYEKQVY